MSEKKIGQQSFRTVDGDVLLFSDDLKRAWEDLGAISKKLPFKTRQQVGFLGW